ncbi:MAG: hypothetical protein WCQ47_03775 [bacterium]
MKKILFIAVTTLIFTACAGRADHSGSGNTSINLSSAELEQQIISADFCTAINLLETNTNTSIDSATLLADKVAGVINTATIFPQPVLAKMNKNKTFKASDLFIRSLEAAVQPPSDPCSNLAVLSGYKTPSFTCTPIRTYVYAAFKCPGMDSSLNQSYFAKAFAKYLLTRGYKTTNLEQSILNILPSTATDVTVGSLI